MKIFTDKTQDQEFQDLGDLGWTGSLNDRQFQYLRDAGFTGALPDMLAQNSGGPAATTHADIVAALGANDGFWDSLLLSGQTIATDGTGPAPGAGDLVGYIANAGGKYPALAAPNDTSRPRVAAGALGHVYDGVTDELGLFLASVTKPTNCDLVIVYEPDADNHVIFDGFPGTDSGSLYAAVAQIGSTSTVLTSSAGTPTIHVTRAGATSSPTTRGELYTAVSAGKCIVEVRGADLSSWFGFSISGLTASGFAIDGTVYGALLLEAPTTGTRDTVRGLLGEYYGVAT